MIEVSVINSYGKVVYDKKLKGYKDYIEVLKNKRPNASKMKEMEDKFLNVVKSDKVVAKYYKMAMTFPLALATQTSVAYAGPLDAVSTKLRVIINPVIELLAGLGYPITYGMLITGSIMIIMGKKSKGLDIIKWACMGYIGLQFVPFLLGTLEVIGTELRNSL